jgi:HEPN domain-containing protein/predicted nucleotidyltransferase
MKSELDHLPAEKYDELRRIVEIIRDRVDAEMVILYGSYARGDWKAEADLAPGRWSGHASDYDILVVVEDQATAEDVNLLRELEQACNAPGFSAHVRPIVHDIAHVNGSIAEQWYFFMDVLTEGVLLYDSGRHRLAEPGGLLPADQQRLAREYFDVWFPQARQFLDAFWFHLERDNLRLAAFNLNQATEHAYKAILLVFTHYCPQEHLLAILGRMAAEHGPVFEDIFPQDTEEQQDRFRLLDNAYIAARYHRRFRVTRADLDDLAPRVKQLLEVTGRICREEIERIGRRGSG